MSDPNQVIESLQNSIQFIHLRKELIEIPLPDGSVKRMLVLENCGLTNARRGRMDRSIKDNPLNVEFIDPLEEYGAARLYVDLACVSFGDVPSLIEFMAMRPEETSVWMDAVMRVNPDMLQWIRDMLDALNEMDKHEIEKLLGGKPLPAASNESMKKKGRKRRRSGSG